MSSLAPTGREPRFEIERTLGTGGMGVVHLVRDHERDMSVALKTLADRDPLHLQRLKSEFRALADIAHPNLVALYELFVEGDRCFFTMEAIDGLRFDAWCAAAPRLGETDLYVTTRIEARRRAAAPEPLTDDEQRPPLARPVADLARLRIALSGLVDGVEALHTAGTLHCDLKPSNVLVTPEGRVVVLDFGLARGRTEASSGNLEGTPAFVAPEQVRDQPPSRASDWYAVGVMLFQALVGELPFTGRHAAATLYQKVEKDAPRVGSRVDGVPSELDALVGSLLERDPARRGGASAIRAWLAGASAIGTTEPALDEPPFVGREAELDALEQAFASSARGEPRFVFLRGASGMGKSALVRRFGERLERDGRALVLASRCYEREQVPFKALDGIVDALASHLSRLTQAEVAALLPDGTASLAVLFPVLRVVDAIAALPVPDRRDPSAVRAAAAVAARLLVRRLSERLPIVMAIDDLQWGDADSAGLIAQIVDPRSESRALLVVCARETPDEPDFVRSLRGGAAHRVVDLRLGPLSGDESIALARSVLATGGDARAEDIVADAGGHPFFLTELARNSARGGASGLDGVVAARVRELGDDARALLETAAVAGVPVGPALLARAAGLSVDPLPALRLLTARTLLRGGARGRAEVETYHDRVREVVAGALAPGRRGAIHAALGAVLADDPDSEPETVAEHLAAGGDAARALPFQVRAAERASRALAFDRAVLLHARAVELAPEGATRQRLRVALADAQVLAGRAGEAAPLYLACAEQAHGAERARLERRAAEEWLKCGRIDDGIAVLRRVLDRVELRYPDSQIEALGRALVRIVRIRRMDGRFVERAAEDVGDATLARVDAARAAGTGLMLVDPLRGYGFLARFLLDAVAAGEPRRVSAGLSLNAVTLCRGGEGGYPQATAWLSRARVLAERLDDDYLRGLADACQAGASVCTGRWQDGARLGLGAPALLRASGAPATWESTAAVSLARTSLLFLGELTLLREHAARHERSAEDVGDLFAATYARVHGWFAAAMDDDVAAGRARLEEALRKWSRLGFHAMHLWRLYGELQYDLYEGTPLRGLERLATQRSALKRSRILAMQFYRAFLTAAEAQLEVARAEEAPGEREARLRSAEGLAAKLRAEGRPYSDGLAALAQARIARVRGREGDALRQLELARARFGASHMALHAAAASALRGGIVGGDEGRALLRSARETVRAQGVVAPDRWLAMLGAGSS